MRMLKEVHVAVAVRCWRFYFSVVRSDTPGTTVQIPADKDCLSTNAIVAATFVWVMGWLLAAGGYLC